MTILCRYIRNDAGSNALEYGLIIAFVSLAVVTGATTAGVALGDFFTALGTELGTLSTTITA
jgi:pilus assembly protein Flp/PilA